MTLANPLLANPKIKRARKETHGGLVNSLRRHYSGYICVLSKDVSLLRTRVPKFYVFSWVGVSSDVYIKISDFLK